MPPSRCTFFALEVSTVPSPFALLLSRTPSSPYTPRVFAGNGPAEPDSPPGVPCGLALGYGWLVVVLSGRAPRLPDMLGLLLGVFVGAVPGIVERSVSDPNADASREGAATA